MNHQDEQIVCADCGATFLFSQAEAAFYAERNLASPPKRCKACRAARKERGQGGGAHAGGSRGGDSRDRRPGGRPFQPRYTGDVNEYRSPMQDSVYFPPPAWGRGDGRASAARGAPPRDDGNYRAPAFGGDPPRRGGAGRSAPSRGGQVREVSGSPQRNAIRDPPRGAIRDPQRGANRDSPRDAGRDSPRDAGRDSPRDAGRDSPRDAGRDAPRDAGRDAPRDAATGEPRSRSRAAKPHAELFDITCKTCGGVAQVPFKPIEGRDVFCQPCYRARKPLRAAGDPS